MEFKTHNEGRIETGGTSLVGEITAPYSKLVKAFGEPTESDGYKSDAEWEVEFEDGTVATIYNWKNGKNYMGSSGTPTERIIHWHIGGFSSDAKYKVLEVLMK